MRVISLFIMLLAFYLVLSGDIFHAVHTGELHHPYLLWAGVVCCAFVTFIAKRQGILDEEGLPIRFVLRSGLYLLWLSWEIVKSSIDIAYRVWHPKLPIKPCLVRVPCSLKTDLGVAVFANSITLTPGTVTVNAKRNELLVHALSEQAAQDLLQGAMQDRIRKVEG